MMYCWAMFDGSIHGRLIGESGIVDSKKTWKRRPIFDAQEDIVDGPTDDI